MSIRELVVLGTASQVPTRYRNHNGYLLRWDGRGILFDPGEGTQRQLIHAGVSASAITRICISHFHGDHCLGLAGIVQRLSLDGVSRCIDIHFPGSGRQYYDRLRHASIFMDKAKTRACELLHDGVVYEDESLKISAARLDHTVEAWGFRVDEQPHRSFNKEKLDYYGVAGPMVGVLQREGCVNLDGRRVLLDEVSTLRPGQSMAFVMDTRPCAAAVRLAKDADLFVCESTYLAVDEGLALERGHMTAEHAARIAVEANARCLVLTHFSQRYGDTRCFRDEAAAIHDHVVVARDGMRVAVPERLK